MIIATILGVLALVSIVMLIVMVAVVSQLRRLANLIGMYVQMEIMFMEQQNDDEDAAYPSSRLTN